MSPQVACSPYGSTPTRSSEHKQIHAVGSSPGDAWGLQDLLGNVMEWCRDSSMPNASKATGDPVGWQGISRARGGAWSMADADPHLIGRTKHLPVTRCFLLGLRIAATGP